jgi:hypothetical protein
MMTAPSVASILRANRLEAAVLGGFFAVAAAGVGLLAAQLALRGNIGTVVATAAILLPVVAWRAPQAGIILFVFAATTIEQYGSLPPGLTRIGTDRVLFFTSFADEKVLSGVPINPLEITIVMLLVFWLLRAAANRTLRLPSSPVALSMAALIIIVAFAEIHGISRGGDVKVSLRELRPWVYLTAGYLLAAQLLTTRRAIWALLWVFILGTGFKGLQGAFRFSTVLHMHPRPDYILAHEEAVFFGLFIVLTAALWLFSVRSRLRWVALPLLPGVIVSDFANGRRVAWLILAASFLLLMVIAWIRLPERRNLIRTLAIAVAVGSLAYFPLYWNGLGTVAQPARAVRSLVEPDQRDKLSNLYRVFEDANLAVNIRRAGPLGAGFGIPIDYTAAPFQAIFDLTSGHDPSLRYIPHNNILYVWLRLGIPGALAFWCMIGFAVVAACRLARATDPQTAVFGCLIVCALVAYLIEGYYDLGLSWFRVALFIGCLLGAQEAAARLRLVVTATTSPLKAAA